MIRLLLVCGVSQSPPEKPGSSTSPAQLAAMVEAEVQSARIRRTGSITLYLFFQTRQRLLRTCEQRLAIPLPLGNRERQCLQEVMTNDTKPTTAKNPKKVNLLDHHSIKHTLDESVTEIVTSRGYVEDVRLSNIRLFLGTIIIIIALVAQFYPKKFPANREFLIGCIVLYIVFNGLLQLIMYTKEKNAILFTYPPAECFNTTGLEVSSKLSRFSDKYTLTIASADPKSISANKPVELTRSVTKWFTEEGELVEGLFWKDVEGLIDDYTKEPKKAK